MGANSTPLVDKRRQQQQQQQQHGSPLARRLVCLAACVRAAYLLLVVGCAHLIRDYDTSASLLSESCADDWPQQAAAAQQYMPGVVWDSVFLHRVAACGYEYEQFFAFYPGLPVLVRLIRRTGLLQGPMGFAATALALNSGCFLLSVWLLTKLGQKLVQDDRVVATAVLVFIASPASIHHSMLYTEALFTATSWLGLYCLYCWGSSTAASLAFAASSAVRSNGLLNAGFILHEHGRRTVADLFARQWMSALKQVVTAVVCTVVCVAPYFSYMVFSYREFCTGVYGKGSPHGQRPWCSQVIPSAYGYVQRVYWLVGFLKYYQWSQIPNFLIAGPTLVMSLWGALAYAAANPHVSVTGGLLPQQLLQQWFGSRGSGSAGSSGKAGTNGSSASSRSTSRGTSRSTSRSSRGPWEPGSGCCSRLLGVIVGREAYCAACGSGSGSLSGDAAAAAAAGAVKAPAIPGVAFQSLRVRQQEVADQQQQKQGQQQQQGQQQLPATAPQTAGAAAAGSQQMASSRSGWERDNAAAPVNLGCTCASNAAFYRPELAVFVVHWFLLTLVCLAVVHIQVATRFLSSCATLYWFAALLMLHKGPLVRFLLWWYCFAFMGVGAVMFTNFLPWT